MNDDQHSGPGGETYLFYDQPAYDKFWKTCVCLDVPLYIHPNAPHDILYEKLYAQRKYLTGPPPQLRKRRLPPPRHHQQRLLRPLPTLKIIIKHLGEKLPFNFWRISHWFEDVERLFTKKAGDTFTGKTLLHFFKNNV